MALDLLFKNTTLVDGSGAPRRSADVGVRDGRIVAIGKLNEQAARVVQADGRVTLEHPAGGHLDFDLPTLGHDACAGPSHPQ